MAVPVSALDLSAAPSPVLPAAYLDACDRLWASLRDRGFAVLELAESSNNARALRDGAEHLDAFFAGTPATKRGARSPLTGEGYTPLTGKELLGYRLGSGQPMPACSAGGKDGRDHLDQACCSLEGLSRIVLSALCRSSALAVHPALLLGLLDDVPLRPGQTSSSVLHASCYDGIDGAVTSAAGGAGRAAPSCALAFAPHHDRGVLTLVASACEAGLQVQRPQGASAGAAAAAGGSATATGGAAAASGSAAVGAGSGSGGWAEVRLGPGHVAVLVGYSLSYALGGLLQPSLHRVRPLAAAGGSVRRRVSQALKLRFRPSARVDPAAVLEEAATQPAGPLHPPLVALELMDVFDAAHPLSVNAAHPLPPAPMTPAKEGPAAAAAAGVAAHATARGVETSTNCKAAAAAQAGSAGATAAGDGRRRKANAPAEGDAEGGAGSGASRRVHPKRAAAGAEEANGAACTEAGRVGASRLLCHCCRKDYANARTLARHQSTGACKGQRGHLGPGAAAVVGAAADYVRAAAGHMMAAAGSVQAAAENVPAAAVRTAGTAAGNAPAAAGNAPAAAAGSVPATADILAATVGGMPAAAAASGASAASSEAAAAQFVPGALGCMPPAATAAPVNRVQDPGSLPVETVRVCIKDQAGNELWVLMRTTQCLGRALLVYCDRNGLDFHSVRFIFQGTRLCPDETPAQLGMENGDVLDALQEQIGD